jgi:uncharacterized protein YraI
VGSAGQEEACQNRGQTTQNGNPLHPSRLNDAIQLPSMDIDNMKRLIWTTAAALVLAVPMIASADNGVTTIGPVHLRTAPNWSAGLLSNVPASSRITINGCTSKWDWCSVTFHGDRGWVPGSYVLADLPGGEVPVTEYTTRTHLPVIGSEGPQASGHASPESHSTHAPANHQPQDSGSPSQTPGSSGN